MTEAAAAMHNDLGTVLSLWSTVPFAGMLLSIALFPLFAPRFWHDHFGKVSLFWAVVLAVPLLWSYRSDALSEFLHIILADYVPFIILISALYVISGGIVIKGRLRGTPVFNTGMLALGTFLASWMGTTGAAMLLIRPFLRANAERTHKVFMVVFFIFLVANIGGSLTPLGDPPLFLGFLRGVPFFWTFTLFPQMVLAAGILLIIYFFMDLHFYKRERISIIPEEKTQEPLRIEGGYNIFLLIGILGAVLMSGIVEWREVSILGVSRGAQDLLRDGVLIGIILFSLIITSRSVREENEFTWFPLQEVAILFGGIFITMAPCLKILQAGPQGGLAFLTGMLHEPAHYLWVTGTLSSFLDNAPTYLTFLTSALGKLYPDVPSSQAIALLIAQKPLFLEAISIGAVFFGAATYVGNAPNFMVRSIAEEAGISMPSFLGYILKYTLTILIPIFIVTTAIFFW